MSVVGRRCSFSIDEANIFAGTMNDVIEEGTGENGRYLDWRGDEWTRT